MPDLDMSPYAAFVWPAWGVSAAVVIALAVRAVAASRRWKRELAKLETADAPEIRPQAAQAAMGREK
ncbi:heme exporter protein CcmD [Brevundimonas sp.]|jgi:heme exporter protein D|uniref:heme exporter protein CcmD n=1 Tax=Brevundimonas sp. TaxID=1871086 RepID=UPI0037C05A25